MGFEEDIENSISLVEWPDKVSSLLLKYNPIKINLKIVDNLKREVILD